jgi:hypothetical protein
VNRSRTGQSDDKQPPSTGESWTGAVWRVSDYGSAVAVTSRKTTSSGATRLSSEVA